MKHTKESERLDQVFAALADPTRRAILRRLVGGDRSVGDLAEPFEMSLPAVSKHLKVLERAGLVSRSVDGRTHTLHLEAKAMKEAARWLSFYQRFWGGTLDSLDKFLRSPSAPDSGRRGNSNPKKKRKGK